MEDTYIGTLISAANMEQHMSMSMSICMGLHAWFKTEMEDIKDVCFLRGLTLAHKEKDPEEMKRLFQSVVSGDTACTNYKPCKNFFDLYNIIKFLVTFSNIHVFYEPRYDFLFFYLFILHFKFLV